MALDADAARLAKGTNLATVVTLMPDGQPQALPTWVDTDGEHVLVNTEPQRQRARNLATVVTLMPNGQPQALPTWIDTDGEYVLVNTEPERQRSKNIARDPRITVLIQNSDNPYDWAEIRGHVVGAVAGEEAREHIDELSRKYTDRKSVV